MLVVEASCLFEVVADTPAHGHIAGRLAADAEQAAPLVIDDTISPSRRDVAH